MTYLFIGVALNRKLIFMGKILSGIPFSIPPSLILIMVAVTFSGGFFMFNFKVACDQLTAKRVLALFLNYTDRLVFPISLTIPFLKGGFNQFGVFSVGLKSCNTHMGISIFESSSAIL